MQKLGKTLNNIYDKIIVIIFIILLLFSCYLIYDTWYIRNVSAGSSYSAYKPSLEEPEAYKKLSNECIGWITIDDTTIDYPIMQANNNSKYLNTNPYGEYSLAGSIFLEWKNSPDFSDSFSLIHGHHMANYAMLGALDLFLEKDYFDKHLSGTLIANSETYKIEIFAFAQTDANERIIFDPTTHCGQYEWILENNIHFREPKSNKRIIALSTCKDPGTTERTMLFCSIVE